MSTTNALIGKCKVCGTVRAASWNPTQKDQDKFIKCGFEISLVSKKELSGGITVYSCDCNDPEKLRVRISELEAVIKDMQEKHNNQLNVWEKYRHLIVDY